METVCIRQPPLALFLKIPQTLRSSLEVELQTQTQSMTRAPRSATTTTSPLWPFQETDPSVLQARSEENLSVSLGRVAQANSEQDTNLTEDQEE